jgi:hypothetical protein
MEASSLPSLTRNGRRLCCTSEDERCEQPKAGKGDSNKETAENEFHIVSNDRTPVFDQI